LLQHNVLLVLPATGMLALIVGIAYPTAFAPLLQVCLAMVVGGGLFLWLNHHGHVRLVAFLTVSFGFIMNTVSAISTWGVHAPSLTAYVAVIVTTGLLLGPRWGIAMTFLSVAASVALARAEVQGFLPASNIQHGPYGIIGTVSITFVYIMVIQYLAGRSLRSALKLAQEELNKRKEAAERLHAKESLLSTVLNTTKDFIVSVDADLRITALNDPFREDIRRRTGIDAVPGTNILDILDREARGSAPDNYRRALNGETLAQVREQMESDGRRRLFVESYNPILSEGGRPEGVTVYAREMTQWIRMDQALRESEERLRTVISNVPVIIFAMDNRGVFRLSEGKGLGALGLRPGEVVGRSVFDVYRDIPAIGESVRRALNGEAQNTVVQVGASTMETYYAPLVGADGQVSGVIGVATDVTAQRQSLDRLKEQASWLDRAHDAIVVKDLDGRISYWNREAERLYGWSGNEVLGKEEGEFLCKEEHLPILQQARSSTMASGEWNGELLQRTRHGSEILVDSRWTLITDDTGRPRSILSINIDISEKKSLQRQLIRSQRLEGLGTLAGGIAHDLNNVLTPIMMSIEGLRTRHTDPRTLKALDTMEAGAQRGADIIKQLLTFARGMKGDYVTLDPRHVLKDVERILRSTFPKSIQCRFRIDPSLAPISGDVTQIHQVLLNLCVNARDAMPEGGTLSVVAENRELDSECWRVNRDAKPGSYVRMEVSDTGHGIPPDILDKIFDPFFTTKEYGKGTGLGLSTALTIVKNHGGFLNVYNIPGHGASFSVYVPSAGPGRTTTLSLPETEQVRGSNELILVVDDEEFVRDVALETLESAGYRVLLALDGMDGLRTFLERKSEIDAVLTDVMMPNMDGLELVKRIRSENQNIPIVAMSGMVASEKLNEMKAYGVRELLLKPFTSRGLAKSIHEALSTKSGIS